MVGLVTRAKNTLHAVLHANQIVSPKEVKDIFHPDVREWWQSLPLSMLIMTRVLSELDTLEFAVRQRTRFETTLGELAAQDNRVPLLVQLPGIGIIGAMTILGAIGDINRFPSAQKLVGYAGLGARVHDSGQSRWTGGITKSGRRDLRRAMVDAANHAIDSNPHWKVKFQKLELRRGKPKARVAIARKLLVVVWYVLTEETADRFGSKQQIAAGFYALAYKMGVRNLPPDTNARQFVRDQLDRLGLGDDMTYFMYGKKKVNLPPSRLTIDS